MILSIRAIAKPSKEHTCVFCASTITEKAMRVNSLALGKMCMEYYHQLCYKLHRQGYTKENIQP